MAKRVFSLGLLVLMSLNSECVNYECKDGVCVLRENPKKAAVKEETASNTGVKELDDSSFDEVMKSSKPVVVDFYATWCGPCKEVKPIFSEISNEESDFVCYSIDIDKAPEVSQKYGVLSLPTFLVFKDGKVVGKILGRQSKNQLVEKIKAAIKDSKEVAEDSSAFVMALLNAINFKDLDKVKELVASGTDLNDFVSLGLFNCYPISSAILSGSEEIIELLLANGARISKESLDAVNKISQFADTSFNMFEQGLNHAIEFKASLKQVNKQYKNDRPELSKDLFEALKLHDTEKFKQLLLKGADVNSKLEIFPGSELTIIGFAAFVNNKPIIELALEAGASLEFELLYENVRYSGLKEMFEKQRSDIEARKEKCNQIIEKYSKR